MTDQAIIACALAFILAGLVKGVIGMGLPTVAMALLGLFIPPAQAASLMVIPSLVTNLWQALAGTHLAPLLRRLFTLLTGICLGTWLAPRLGIGLADAAIATTGLGAALMLYAVFALALPPLRVGRRLEAWLSPAAGLLTGLVSGATGVFVMPSVPYLQSLPLSKDELVQALGLTFAVATLALGVTLIGLGHLDTPTAGASVLALAPAMLGLAAGQLIRKATSPARFRLIFLGGTLLVGAHLALRPFI